MSISTRQRIIDTSHGSLAVDESGQGKIPLLLIHGNSFCRGVNRHQLHGSLAENHGLSAFDLPGHGQSSNAPDPVRAYTRPGLVDATIELLEKMGVSEAIVFGWSLGGHIGIEMLSRFPGMRDLMISGAPPVRSSQMSQGFNASPRRSFASKQELSTAEIDAFVESIFGKSAEAFLPDAVARTDGHFRKRLFEAARAGEGVDQRLTVESIRVPLAVVSGAADRIVNLDYFDTVAYAQFVGWSLSSPERVGARPFLGSARRLQSGTRTVPSVCRTRLNSTCRGCIRRMPHFSTMHCTYHGFSGVMRLCPPKHLGEGGSRGKDSYRYGSIAGNRPGNRQAARQGRRCGGCELRRQWGKGAGCRKGNP